MVGRLKPPGAPSKFRIVKSGIIYNTSMHERDIENESEVVVKPNGITDYEGNF